ncbi:hypothetical protein [Thalassoroseus pseudoceratinae]|uniref:hypothetical protein n=1 Tax=Thalassoroseus pseudoceratinae TaxID=2713176 RepID=UPI001422C84D|nr:hypothetical protein [Thalassoroseus pseudoceratinae]
MPEKKPLSMKKMVALTVVWVVLMLGGGLLVSFLTFDKTAPRRVSEAKMQRLATGIGTLTGIGAGILWIPFAFRIGKQKREEAERKRVAKRKRPRK